MASALTSRAPSCAAPRRAGPAPRAAPAPRARRAAAPRASADPAAFTTAKTPAPKDGLIRIISEENVRHCRGGGGRRRAGPAQRRATRAAQQPQTSCLRRRAPAQRAPRSARTPAHAAPLPLPAQVRTVHIAETMLPTRHGNFRLRGYKHSVGWAWGAAWGGGGAHGPGGGRATRPPMV
jgi:hypothetical protein